MNLLARSPSCLRDRCLGCNASPALAEPREIWTLLLKDHAAGGQRIGTLCPSCSSTFARWYEAQHGPVQTRAFQRLRKVRG